MMIISKEKVKFQLHTSQAVNTGYSLFPCHFVNIIKLIILQVYQFKATHIKLLLLIEYY